MTLLTELMDKYQQSYEELKDNVLKILQDIAKKDNIAIVLSGYYPYFNDGDICTYSGSVFIYGEPTMEELCDLAEQEDLEFNYHYNEEYLVADKRLYVVKDDENIKSKYLELYRLADYQDILQAITGNNADVVITPDKVEVWETDPY